MNPLSTHWAVNFAPDTKFEPKEFLTFLQQHEYTDAFIRFGLTDEEQRGVEFGIMAKPLAATVVEGTGGIREFQIGVPNEGPGSLHLSVFYAYFPESAQVALIGLFETDELAPMNEEERRELKKLFEQCQIELEASDG